MAWSTICSNTEELSKQITVRNNKFRTSGITKVKPFRYMFYVYAESLVLVGSYNIYYDNFMARRLVLLLVDKLLFSQRCMLRTPSVLIKYENGNENCTGI